MTDLAFHCKTLNVILEAKLVQGTTDLEMGWRLMSRSLSIFKLDHVDMVVVGEMGFSPHLV